MRCAILVLALAGACSKSERAKPPPPTEGIEMIDPGGTPQKLLRYHLAKGAKAPMELAMDLDMAVAERGGAMPTVVMLVEIRVDDVLPDGSAKVRTKLVSASARPRAGKETVVSADLLTAQAAQLAGVELTATLSPAGRLSESKVDVTSKELPPSFAAQIGQLGQSLEQVAMLLPDVPIGPGAKWKNRKTVRQNNVAMQTITTIEVVAIDGDKLTFKSSSEVTGANQKVDFEGNQLAISGIGGGGRGSGVVDLGRMVMSGELGAEFHFDMTAQEHKSATTMEVAMRMKPLESIEPAAEPPPATDVPAAAAKAPSSPTGGS